MKVSDIRSMCSEIGFSGKLPGTEEKIWAERDRKLEAAREERKRRQAGKGRQSCGLDLAGAGEIA
jgi:hypothetical protein